jgi:predicted RNase H-like nuclease (RuvC/YqgF family)
MMKVTWLIAPLIICLCTPSAAEFYKYTDKGGTVRFTDDLSKVPEDQRPDATRYDESVSTPSPPIPGNKVDNKQRSVEPETEKDNSLETQSRKIREKLDALEKEYQTLMKEKNSLEAEAKNAKTVEETVEFNRKISNLNQKVSQYSEKRKALSAEIEAFNAKAGSKDAGIK